jgi:transposase-like protein
MTHKRLGLSEEAKDFIVDRLTTKMSTVTQMANFHGCHPRTINRVMEERGLAAVTSKAKGISDAARVKKLLKEADMTMGQLEQLIGSLKTTPSLREQARTAALFRPGAQIKEAAHA